MTAATLGLTRLVIAEVAVRHPAKLVMEAVSLHAQLATSAAQQAELEAKHAALSARKPDEKVQRTRWLRHTGPQQLPPALPRLLCQLAEEDRATSLEAAAGGRPLAAAPSAAADVPARSGRASFSFGAELDGGARAPARGTSPSLQRGGSSLPPSPPKLLSSSPDRGGSSPRGERGGSSPRPERSGSGRASCSSAGASGSARSSPSLDSMCPEAQRLHAWQAAAPGLERDAAQAREMKAPYPYP